MKKKKSLLIAALIGVVLVGTVALAQTDMLQGRFSLKSKFDPLKIFLYNKKYVSVVTSPVTSVDTSEVTSTVTSDVSSKVTSKGGTSKVTSKVSSKVTSKVPSTYTTPVASAVAVSADWAEKAKNYDIKQLTKTILEKAAKEDYKANPSKYILSTSQRMQLINLYQQQSKTTK